LAAGIVVEENLFPLIAAELHAKVDAVTSHAAEQVAQGAAERSDVETGAMRDAWTAEGDEVSNPIYYSRFHEYGTRIMPAHPMLEPALQAKEPIFVAELITVFEI
jgi:HK97 gp10 family phage protein